MDEDVMMVYRSGHSQSGTAARSEGLVLYQAIKAFSPAGSGEVALEIDDILKVAEGSSSSAPAGWLLGINQRTEARGYFPCAYTKRLDTRSLPSTASCEVESHHSNDDYTRMARLGDETSRIGSSVLPVDGRGGGGLYDPVTPQVNSLDTSQATLMTVCSEESSGFSSGQAGVAGVGANVNRGHRIIHIFFLTPMLCRHCNDYIWGVGRVGSKCESE